MNMLLLLALAAVRIHAKLVEKTGRERTRSEMLQAMSLSSDMARLKQLRRLRRV